MKHSLTFVCMALVSASGLLAFATADARHARDDRAVPVAAAAGDVAAPALPVFTCDGHTKGFWTNQNGQEVIEASHFLGVLPSLHLVDENGAPFTTTSYEVFKEWMQDADAYNMAYMLSAQLAAMKFNILAGYVNERCVIRTAYGEMPISRLMEQALEALIKDPYTVFDDTHRRRQEGLKDLLDAANNNLIWSD